MTLQQLRYFLAVVKWKSFPKGAVFHQRIHPLLQELAEPTALRMGALPSIAAHFLPAMVERLEGYQLIPVVKEWLLKKPCRILSTRFLFMEGCSHDGKEIRQPSSIYLRQSGGAHTC